MLKNQLTTLLIILSFFVLGFDFKNQIFKLEKETKFSGEPAKNALSIYSFENTRRNNDTKYRALNNINRVPNVTNSTISINGDLEKIAREHYVDDGSYSGENFVKLKFI